MSEYRLKATLLASTEEHDHGPGEGGDEQEPGHTEPLDPIGLRRAQSKRDGVESSPVEGTETSDGRHHIPS